MRKRRKRIGNINRKGKIVKTYKIMGKRRRREEEENKNSY